MWLDDKIINIKIDFSINCKSSHRQIVSVFIWNVASCIIHFKIHNSIHMHTVNMHVNIMRNNYLQRKSALGSDTEFTRRYFKYFSHLGIFPYYPKTVSRLMIFFSKCLSFLVLLAYAVQVVCIYSLKIDYFYNRMDIPQIMIDVVGHLIEVFACLVVFVGAIKDGQSWRIIFEDFMQIDNILKSKGSYMVFNYYFHLIKIVGYILISFIINMVSIYYWRESEFSLLNIFHHILFSCIMVVIVFIVDIMGSVRRRCICLNTEVAKVFSISNSLISENAIENDITYIKLIYGLLNDIMTRINTLFGPQIFSIISFLLMILLNSFNWLSTGFYEENTIPLVARIIDLLWDPLTSCVSKHNCCKSKIYVCKHNLQTLYFIAVVLNFFLFFHCFWVAMFNFWSFIWINKEKSRI